MCDTLSKNQINTLTNHKYESLILPKENHKELSSDLKIESERIKTFRHWTNEANPEDLAKIGLYFLKASNKVKCVFCDIEISATSLGDNPLDEHLKQSPACPCARAKKGQNTLSTLLRALPANQDVCGNLDTCPDLKLLKQIVRPYEDFTARLKSFENWPKSSKQNPEKLAQAGFFYKGVGDKTVCFQCSGPLNNWEDLDDPWEQHALWFPQCEFLLALQGKEFVEGVQKKLKRSSWDLHKTDDVCKDGLDDDKMCIICCNSQREVVFVPCGHDWTCWRCMRSLEDKKCPICREQIIQTRML